MARQYQRRLEGLVPISPDLWQGSPESEGWIRPLPAVEVIWDRQSFLQTASIGRSVVHVGFGDAGARDATEAEGRWVHDAIVARSARVVGLDIDADAVARAKAAGDEAYCVDCTSPEAVSALHLPEPDLIILGEVIEHVGNPGGLLQAMRSIAVPHTKLVITTPNAFRLASFINVATRRETLHPDHVAIWSLPLLAAIVVRNGWEPESAAMYQVPTIRNRSVARSSGMRGIVGAAVRRGADTMVRRVTPYWADGLILQARPGLNVSANG